MVRVASQISYSHATKQTWTEWVAPWRDNPCWAGTRAGKYLETRTRDKYWVLTWHGPTAAWNWPRDTSGSHRGGGSPRTSSCPSCPPEAVHPKKTTWPYVHLSIPWPTSLPATSPNECCRWPANALYSPILPLSPSPNLPVPSHHPIPITLATCHIPMYCFWTTEIKTITFTHTKYTNRNTDIHFSYRIHTWYFIAVLRGLKYTNTPQKYCFAS